MRTLARPRDKAEILRRLRGLRPETAARWGRMSAHQMVCHLADAFGMAMGHKPVRHAASVLDRTLVKWIALYLPVPWPRGIRTAPEIDQERDGTRPGEFAADLARLEELVEKVTAPARSFVWETHPRLGPLSDRAWLRWGYRHMDHHLRQFGR